MSSTASSTASGTTESNRSPAAQKPRAAAGAGRVFAAFCSTMVRRIDEDRCFQVAAGLTFTTLLALVPLFTVVLSVSTAFPAFEQWIDALQQFVMRNFLPETGRRLINTQLSEFAGKAAQLTAIGLVFLGITALSLMLSIDETFNRLFRVQQQREVARRVLIYLAALAVVPVLVGASVSITSWILGLSLGYLGQPQWVSIGALRFVPYAFTCIAFTLIYYLLPNRQVEPRHAIAGGLIAGLAFEMAKLGFAMYIKYFPTYTMIYGTFAAIPIFLLWVYVSWVVVVIGATITAVLPQFDVPAAGPADAAGADAGTIAPQTRTGEIAMPVPPPAVPPPRAGAPDRRERLIVALDVPTAAEARALAQRLGDSVKFYKIGLELFTAGGYFELLDWLAAHDKKVFADLKFYDIPETVRRAVSNLRGSGATFVTVHGHRSVMEAAVSAKSGVRILAVTVLTSFDKSDLAELGAMEDVGRLVLSRARGALESGCDGVISSGLEAPQIKAAFGNRLTVVTPGIRPVEATRDRSADDQKRTVDVARAFANGADYIVVGRPIREAADPRAAAESIQSTIAGIFPA